MDKLNKIKALISTVGSASEKAPAIAETVNYIKDCFFDDDFKSDDNWLFAVNTLKDMANLDALATRNALKYKFPKSKYNLDDYKKILISKIGDEGKEIIEKFRNMAAELKETDQNRIVVMNATFFGGGVAEMMQTAGPILEELGIELEWHIIYPTNAEFYDITKAIHNTIQGKDIVLSEKQLKIWEEVNRLNSDILQSLFHDDNVPGIFVEDPQVAPMIPYIKKYNPEVPLIWRKHIDISGIRKSNEGAMIIWNKILEYLDHLSDEDIVLFQPGHIPDGIEQYKFNVFSQYPGIDPLKPKNALMSLDEMRDRIKIINKACNTSIDPDKPYVVVGARFDYWKGLACLLRAFESIAEHYPDINIIVFGGYANDDPEGVDYFNIIKHIIKNSEIRERVELVYNQVGKEIGALYRLAAAGKMPFCSPSIAEGYCLMTDEAAVQGAVPFTSEAGGLSRYPDGIWRVNILDIAANVSDASRLHELIKDDGDHKLTVSKEAKLIEERIAEKLKNLFEMRKSDIDKYHYQYEEAAIVSQNMAFKFSLISMLLNYMSLSLAKAKHLEPFADEEEVPSADVVREEVHGDL